MKTNGMTPGKRRGPAFYWENIAIYSIDHRRLLISDNKHVIRVRWLDGTLVGHMRKRTIKGKLQPQPTQVNARRYESTLIVSETTLNWLLENLSNKELAHHVILAWCKSNGWRAI